MTTSAEKYFKVLLATSLAFAFVIMAAWIISDYTAAKQAEEAAAVAPEPKTRIWGGAVYSYTDPRSGQRYLIVSTGYHGGVTMIKAEPDKLPEAK